MIQIGRESPDPYVVRSLYGEYLPAETVGHVLVWHLERVLRRWEAQADLVFFRKAGFRPPEAVARRMLMLPYYVAQVIDLPPRDSDLFACFHNHNSTARKSDLDTIRKARFHYEVTHDPEMMKCFYHDLYVPFIQSRHHDYVEFFPWPKFKVVFGEMELLLVRQDSQLVAGIVNQQVGNIYHMNVAGARSAEKEFLKTGVMSALYWFSFVEAHRRGCLQVDTGDSRPFLRDGVLTYKKKWNSRITASVWKRDLGLWLLPCGSRPSMYRALENNPFFCEQDGKLTGLVFLGDHTALNDKELASYLKQVTFSGEGLSICIVLLTEEWRARAETIQSTLSNYSHSYRILDLSRGSLAELPGLLRH